MAVTENDVLVKYKDSSGNMSLIYPLTKKENVDGLDEAIRDQSVTTAGTGSAYTATVEGITVLTAGVSFVMLPHVVSAANNPTLDVNGLGAKYIRRRVSNSSSTTTTGASDTWLAANKPIRVTYDGTFWIADLVKPNATDLMGIVPIQNGGTGASTSNNARINLGITDTYGAIINSGYCYAECRQWADSNTSSENRTGYFVCNDNTDGSSFIRKATTADDILGVTVAQIYGDVSFATSCFSSSYTSSGALSSAYTYVAVRGMVTVIDNGTCTVGGRCMPNDDGVAEPVSGDYGYLVLGRSDDNRVLIYVDPSVSMAQYKLKQQVDNGHSTPTATLSATWTGDSAPYTQTVTVTGIKADDCPHIIPIYSSTVATAITEKEAWGMVSKAEVTAANAITFTCFEDKPTVPINLQIEVNR